MKSEILIALIASGTLSTIINVIVMALKDWQDRKKGLRASMRILLDDRLTWLGEKHIQEGSISQENLKIFIKMHECYKNLGGNGYHLELMKRINNLPIAKEKNS